MNCESVINFVPFAGLRERGVSPSIRLPIVAADNGRLFPVVRGGCTWVDDERVVLDPVTGKYRVITFQTKKDCGSPTCPQSDKYQPAPTAPDQKQK